MFIAVAKIDENTDCAPDEEAHPGVKGEVIHQITAGKYCKWRYDVDQWAFEFTR